MYDAHKCERVSGLQRRSFPTFYPGDILDVDNRLNIFKQKCQTLAGSSFLNIKIFYSYFSLKIVNKESLGFRQLKIFWLRDVDEILTDN